MGEGILRAFENIAIAIAVVLVAMACMVFGDWLARSKGQPNYYYCQNASAPDYNKLTTPQESTTSDKKEARETANERYHELCSQWRAAKAAEDATHVAWLQLWFGVGGLIGLGMTVYFTARAAGAASEAARETARSVDVQMRIEQPLLIVTDIIVDVDDRFPTVAFRLHNIGKTPAVLLQIAEDASGAAPDAAVYKFSSSRGEILRSDDKRMVHALIQRSSGAKDQPLQMVFFWGAVDYEDVFGDRRRMGFCYRGSYSALLSEVYGRDIKMNPYFLWWRHGGDAYNYDREEKPQT